jgi:2-phosphosulfolactate phosphatase
MKFIISDDKNLHESKEALVVVIDVIRAFTTACYAMENNPKDYIIVRSLDLARKLKKDNPDYVLLGERNGYNLPGFDYVNSPTEIKDIDFSNKTIVHTTSLGTKGIVNTLKYTNKIITGSFVNAKAIIKYIKRENPNYVCLFCTNGLNDDNEDLMFAKYIVSHFEDKPLDINTIRNNLANKHKSRFMYLIDPRTEYSKSDFFLSLELDKFDFVIEAYMEKDGLVHLRKKVNSN